MAALVLWLWGAAFSPAAARFLLSDGSFGAGYLGPLETPSPLAFMAMVGLWAGQMKGSAVWQLPCAAVVAATAAAVLGRLGVMLPYAGHGAAVGLVALGAAVAVAARVPLSLAVAGVAVGAVFHGYGQAGLANHWPLALFHILGSLCGFVLIVAAGVGMTVIVTGRAAAPAVRIAGVSGLALGCAILSGYW